MKPIPNHLVTSWSESGGYVVPQAARVRCGHCKVQGIFTMKNVAKTQDLLTCSSTSNCPSCNKIVRFFSVVTPSNDVRKPDTVVYVHPEPDFERLPINGSDVVPEDLQAAYLDALSTYNSSAPTSAVLNQCRQALEAIVIAAMPSSEYKPLARLLNELPANVDLGQPILDIAAALRHAGNMGSHYKAGRKIPTELRDEMMDMLDQMLEYLFIIPTQVRDTRQRITNVDTGASAEAVEKPN